MSVSDGEVIIKPEQEKSVEEIKFPFLYKWCNLNANHFYIVFGIGLGIHFSFLFLTILFVTTDTVKIFYLAFDNIPMYDIDYEPYQCYRAWNYFKIYWMYLNFDYSILLSYGEIKEMPLFVFYFEADDGNIFTPNNLRMIYNISKTCLEFLNKLKVCTKSCSRYTNVLSMILAVNNNDLSFSKIDQTIKQILQFNESSKFFRNKVSIDLKLENGKYTARSFKTEIPIYIPGSTTNQKIIKRFYEMYNEYYSRIYFYMEFKYLLGDILLDQVIRDTFLTLGSLLFVYIFTYIQTKSLFITFFQITSIFTTFCMANFVHTLIFGIKFFGIFHVLSIFIILGIGCDNLFVFYDRWKSFERSKYSLVLRLYSSYTGVGWSMLITSLTTALAFCILAWTKLLTIFSFGVFVTLLVIINYLSLLLFLPSVIIIHHHKFHNEFKPDKVFIFVTRFFKVYYYNFLNYKFVKYVILAIFGAITIVGIIFVSRLKVAEEFPALFVSSFPYSRMEYLRNNYYEKHEVDEHLEIVLLLGVKNLDYSSCAYWNYTCEAPVIYDDNFSINAPGIQEQYKNICDTLMKPDKNLKTELSLFDDMSYHVNCLLLNMDEYYHKKFPNKNFQIPWKTSNFLELAPLALNFTVGPDFPYKFETALYYFLSDGLTFSDYGKYNIFQRNELIARYRKKIYGNGYGYNLNVSAILLNITLYQRASTFSEKKKIFKNWIKWTENLRKKMNVMVCGSQEDLSLNGYFHWIHLQEMLISAALAGLLSGLIIACPIILMATRNIYTFLIIILSTCLSTLSVISMISIIGWDLGLLESLNLTLIVGLTIDYLVHMGLAYNSSKKKGREERTEEMLEDMGVSVLSGMATTLGSSFFLFFCTTMFLFQFGIFVFATIFSAGIYSMIFLPCFFLAFGPQNK